MLKKIPDAEWARIAARLMKGKSAPLTDICAGNWPLRKIKGSEEKLDTE